MFRSYLNICLGQLLTLHAGPFLPFERNGSSAGTESGEQPLSYDSNGNVRPGLLSVGSNICVCMMSLAVSTSGASLKPHLAQISQLDP